MLPPSVFFAFALVSAASAQGTPLAIQAIEAHFKQSAIVPDLFATFEPTALLSLNYPGVGDVQPGQALTKEQVGSTPAVTVTPADSSTQLTGAYTLAMVDADIVGSDLSQGETRHWLVNGVTISNSIVSNTSAVGITTYAGPAPASGSGSHRYVVALYAQPSTFAAPAAYSQPNIGVSVFDFNAYVKESGLGPLVAATYINVEEGTATVTVSPTSAVITSTLKASSSSSGQSKGTSKGTSSTPAATGSSGPKTGGATTFGTQIPLMAAGAILSVVFM